MLTTVAYQRSTVHTVSDVRAIADHAGSYFFARGTMRFFSSRVMDGVYAVGGRDAVPGAVFYFVTSEVYGDAPRHYAVRRLTLGTQRDNRPAVDIATVDTFDTLYRARSVAKEYARNGEDNA